MANIQNTYNLIDGSGAIVKSGNDLQTIYDYISANPNVSGVIQQIQTVTTTISIVSNGTYH